MIAMSFNDSHRLIETLDSELLRTFLAVAEAGSISAGAERRLRSQSAASLQIKRLEDLIGLAVFERHGRGVTLTTTGEELREVAQRVVALLDEALGRLRSQNVVGSIRVGIPDEYGRTILPKVLAAFSRQHPSIEVTVRCAMSAEFPAALDRGELDVAVHDTDKPRPGQTVLREQQMLWVASRRHGAHQLSPVPIVVYDKDCWWRKAALSALRDSRIDYRLAYVSESIAGVNAAIEAGTAVGVINTDAMQPDFATLDPGDGFPVLPKSILVLARRAATDQALAQPMCDAIVAAFNRPSNA